ncbi:unnamed protein product [Parascedosporium putredinis]|uniref:Uncharacterized protein n=1 Tax=Parascedosporium putredinis TaxID=1442378 RepID=A0A9P1H0Q7_9PEZI|nr:unnamed protein product [Parascedosporium putredinis]CAI7991991.1 unnamed protein product [Parascedosporium putredinis]
MVLEPELRDITRTVAADRAIGRLLRDSPPRSQATMRWFRGIRSGLRRRGWCVENPGGGGGGPALGAVKLQPAE